MKTNSVIRMHDLHDNKDGYRTAAKQYFMCYVAHLDGTMSPCLLTEDDVGKGLERAINNPEDVKKLSLFQRCYHKILNIFQ